MGSLTPKCKWWLRKTLDMYRGKRFLITQPMIHHLNGSTIVALELATYLSEEEASVTVYTYFCSDPAKNVFRQKHIKVVTADDNPTLLLTDFDYVWVHSQVLPLSIVRSLGRRLPRDVPAFIFHHMSPLDWIPDERPYIVGMEESLSSQSLFISKNTLQSLEHYFTRRPSRALFSNPAPVSFSCYQRSYRKKIRRVLIVSNHSPEELLEARVLLEARGVIVSWLGERGDKYHTITPATLAPYDVVITIGKTVQYCLVSGIPVYVYDHFGGCGYLNDHNYSSAKEYNFAGREASHKTAEEIAEEIVQQYNTALEYYRKHRDEFIDEYTIDRVFPRILDSISPRQITRFSRSYVSALESAQIFAKNRFQAAATGLNDYRDKEHYLQQIEELRATLDTLSKHRDSLELEIKELRQDLNSIYSSKSYRLSRLVTYPLRHTMRAIKGRRG